jgi:hypothetical protein
MLALYTSLLPEDSVWLETSAYPVIAVYEKSLSPSLGKHGLCLNGRTHGSSTYGVQYLPFKYRSPQNR